MFDKLLPCPFCGGEAEFVDDLYGMGTLVAVTCLTCDASQVTDYGSNNTQERLIAQWNTRVAGKQGDSNG